MNASAKSLEKILGTGGLAERLTAELDVERAERHEAARKIVVAAEARYPKDIAPAMAAHSAAQAKLKAIIDSQEPALADCIKAAAGVDEIRDAHRAVTDPAQAVMLANADPAIDVFIAELITLKQHARTCIAIGRTSAANIRTVAFAAPTIAKPSQRACVSSSI